VRVAAAVLSFIKPRVSRSSRTTSPVTDIHFPLGFFTVLRHTLFFLKGRRLFFDLDVSPVLTRPVPSPY